MQTITVWACENEISWHNETGRLHREDGPACVHRCGFKSYYLLGWSCAEKDFYREVKKLQCKSK